MKTKIARFFQIFIILVFLLGSANLQPVFAQDETPVVTEPVVIITDNPEGDVTEEPTLETEVPVVEVAATEVPFVPTEVVTVEPSEPPQESEDLAEIVTALSSEGIQITGVNGDLLPLASQDTADALTNGDPYFVRGSTTYYFIQSGACPGSSVLDVNCFVSPTPIEAAIAMYKSPLLPTPAVGENIITVLPGNYIDHVVIDVTGLTLMGIPGSIMGADPTAPVLTGTSGPGITILAKGVTISGFAITGYDTGVYIDVASSGNNNINITNNTITGNDIGIQISKDTGSPGITISNNLIFGNLLYGLVNNESNNVQFIDAPNNYWGCPTGPVVAAIDKKDDLIHYYQFDADGSGKDMGLVKPVGCELVGGQEALWDFQIKTNDWSPYKINLDTFVPCPPGQVLEGDVCITPTPALSIVKTVTPSTYDEVGDVLSYSYVVKNVGNVTLSGPFTVTDDKATATCPATATLAPNATITCTASYSVKQADLDAGSVTNIASASNGTVTSPTDTETATAEQSRGLSIVKTVTPSTYDEVGDVLSYSYVVKNVGNVTLSGPFTVTDDKATATCPATATLAPNATITCTASYSVSQADLDAGSVTNIASASNGQVTSPTDTETATAVKSPALLIEKTVTSTGPYLLGSTISYNIEVTNTGNVTLNNVSITDPAAVLGTCPVTATLAVGATKTCTATHVVVAADVTSGSFTNTGIGDSDETTPVTSSVSSIITAPTIIPPVIPVTGGTPPALLIPVTGGQLIPVTGGTLIVSGLGHSCMTYNNGQVICWGLNASGQVGDGTLLDQHKPVYVKDLEGVLNLTAGSKHTCALMIDGEIWCWGENSSGQLGNNTVVNSNVPVKVEGLPDKVLAITAGEEFTCAQMMNQDVWCWGKNNLGQLNDGTTTNQLKPVKSKLNTMLAQISGGQEFLLGSDFFGSVNEWAKVQAAAVQQLAGSLSISANRWGDTGCAVASDGSVKCWDSNLISTPIKDTLPAMEVGAGMEHNCVVNNDQTVSCWGVNLSGQLGNGSNTDSLTATLVKNMSKVRALGVGANHTCVLSGTNNAPMCWGENTFGQLGNDSTTNSNLPVYVILPAIQ